MICDLPSPVPSFLEACASLAAAATARGDFAKARELVEKAPGLPPGSVPATCNDEGRRRSSRLSPRWPERPLGLSSRRLVELLDVRDETLEREAAAAGRPAQRRDLAADGADRPA